MSTKAILGQKLGMTQIFEPDSGEVIPVTVIKVSPCRVVQVKTVDRDGYEALQLAFGERKPSRHNKPEKGHIKKAGIESYLVLKEVRVDNASDYSAGDEVKADVFEAGDLVDVTGTSKGRGFQGVMKRHGFAGLPGSHGAHRVHRAPGSIGMAATPARVFKGKRMAGRHGNSTVTVSGLTVIQADAERGILLLKGAVPGSTGSVVTVKTAYKASKASRKSA
ncbi:MAG: 50S ribosomal protein L3 [Acidimicrobiia bacterium]